MEALRPYGINKREDGSVFWARGCPAALIQKAIEEIVSLRTTYMRDFRDVVEVLEKKNREWRDRCRCVEETLEAALEDLKEKG